MGILKGRLAGLLSGKQGSERSDGQDGSGDSGLEQEGAGTNPQFGNQQPHGEQRDATWQVETNDSSIVNDQLANQVKQLSMEDLPASADVTADFREEEFISYSLIQLHGPAADSFIALPLKYADNRSQDKNALGFKIASDVPMLDFKTALLPTIVGPGMAERILMVDSGLLDPNSLGYSGPQLPTGTQWALLNSLRVHATAPMISEQGRDKLIDYYMQLLVLEEKFPSTEKNGLKIDFTWHDISGEHKVVTQCIHYEKAATLYNIAAIYSILGCQAAKTANPNSIALAANYFQKAAGICQTVLGIVPMMLQKVKSLYELSSENLTFLTSLMMAQANECFLHKAAESKVSPIAVAKVAIQVCDRYETLQPPSYISKHKLTKPWVYNIRSRSAIFSALANEHMPLKDTEGKTLREKLARINIAKESLTEVLPKSTPETLATFIVEYLSNLEGTISKIKEKMMVDLPDYDRKILLPIPRPATHLTSPVEFELELSACMSRAFDCFPTVVGPTHSESIGILFQESSAVCKPAKFRLKEIIQGIAPSSIKGNSFLKSLDIGDTKDLEQVTSDIALQQQALKEIHTSVRHLQADGADSQILLEVRTKLVTSAKHVSEMNNDWTTKLSPRLEKAMQTLFKSLVDNESYYDLQKKAQTILQHIRTYEESLNSIIAEAVVTQRSIHEIITQRLGKLNILKNETKTLESEVQILLNRVFSAEELKKQLDMFKCCSEFKKELHQEATNIGNISRTVKRLGKYGDAEPLEQPKIGRRPLPSAQQQFDDM